MDEITNVMNLNARIQVLLLSQKGITVDNFWSFNVSYNSCFFLKNFDLHITIHDNFTANDS